MRFRIANFADLCFRVCEHHKQAYMGKPHPMELRTRVFDFVEEGNTHRATAAHFRVQGSESKLLVLTLQDFVEVFWVPACALSP